MNNKTGAIVLAAGKGTRMKSREKNKVTLMLGDKPIIVHAVNLLESANLSPIIVVVGYAKDSVKKLFKNNILFAEQKKRLGTAHAAMQGLKVLPNDIDNIFILNGDDSFFYTKQVLSDLLKEHMKNKNAITFLTLKVKDPKGLGRVVRKSGKVVAIVEEKDATNEQKKINEINPALYLFNVDFLKEYLSKVKKSKVTGEYYLPELIHDAIENNFGIEGVDGGKIPWRGVNTGKELEEANQLYSSANP